MGPDRSNYEIWLIDYLDGTLDRERTGLLLAFLDENPDLKEEFASLSASGIILPDTRFRKKNELKRSAPEMSQKQFELLCVAAAENDLEDGRKEDLDEIILSDPEKRLTFDLISRIKLTPPEHKYRYKYKLRKLTASQKVFRYSLAFVSTAAAVVAIIMSLGKPATDIPGVSAVAVNIVKAPAPAAGSHDKIAEKASPLISQDRSRTLALNTVAPARNEMAVKENPVAQATSNDSLLRELKRFEIAKIACYEEGLKRSGNEINLVAINLTPVNNQDDPENNGPGKLVEKILRDNVIKPGSSEKGSIKAFDLADAGIRGLRRLFGWNISLKKNIDEKGDVKSVSFNSKLISFNAPVRKSTRLP